LSTGGGAVLREANRQHLHARGKVVYLRSTPEEVFRRLKHDMQRPLLQVSDPLERLENLFNLRDPLYREVAHYVFDTGRPSINKLLNAIIAELELDGFDSHVPHHPSNRP
jgi:shikimate kinase